MPQQAYHPQSGPDAGKTIFGDAGIPQDMVDRGIYTTTGYQIQAQKDLSDQQLKQQKDIADQQNAFNLQQLADMKAQQDKIQQQADEQAARQNTYDKGRADLLQQGTDQVNAAFAKFSPDYFNQYAQDYMTKATDDINYQKGLATKNLLFGLARQGLTSSQTRADQMGLLEEDAGKATAAQTQNSLDATDVLKSDVAKAKQGLIGQVQGAESIGSPIAGSTDASVSGALDTQRGAISGITGNAGNTIASLGGVPTVSPMTNIFANVLGATGSYISGQNANYANSSYLANRTAAMGGTSPGSSSGSIR